MFEIGTSLREARLRQGLDLAHVEDDTKIRAKYIQGLEDERFEILPSETYVKGFLRTYAEYLGLDGQLYVDEFNSRFAPSEETRLAATPSPPRRTRAAESSFLVAGLAAIVAVAVLVVVAFTLGSDGPEDPAAELARAPGTAASPPAGRTPPAAAGPDAPARPKRARLVLTAARGDCWVAVRTGAADGELLFSGTMFMGETKRFSGKRLWLEFGEAPSQNLNVRLNGKRVRSFPTGAPVVLVTPRGVRAQS